MFNAHGMQPDVVFGVLDMLGAQAGRILVVGCQPASLELEMGLSEPVAAAVDGAVRVVSELVTEVSAALPQATPATRPRTPHWPAGRSHTHTGHARHTGRAGQSSHTGHTGHTGHTKRSVVGGYGAGRSPGPAAGREP